MAYSQRPARHLAPAGGADPARLHQHVERALGDLHAADRLDLGAADRLVIGDDRQRLDRRRGSACAAPRARGAGYARDRRRSGNASARRARPARCRARHSRRRARQRRAAAPSRSPSTSRRSRRRQRRLGGEQRRLDRADEVVGLVRVAVMPRGSSAARRRAPGELDPALPRQLERRDEARGQRRAAIVAVVAGGQEALERGPVDRAPIIARARAIASSSVITGRRATMCTTGSARARTAP